MIRATTSGVLLGYRTNLMNSFVTLNKSRDTVLSQRLFNSYAEDPAAAAKAFRLRRSRMAVQSQYDITDSTYRKYQVAWKALDSTNEIVDTKNVNSLKDAALRVLNDPTGDARETLSKTLSQMSDSIIQNMNQKYGDNFVFAGADGANVPFEIRQVDGQDHVFYRGIDVDVEVPECLGAKDGQAPNDFISVRVDNGKIVTDPNGDSYLKMKGTSVISVADYEDAVKKAEIPKVKMDNGKPVEYDYDETTGDIKEYIFGIDVPDDRGEGGYYLKLKDDGSEPAPPTKDDLIPVSEYNAKVELTNNLPKLLGDGTNYQLVDKDGNAKNPGDPGDDYYLILGEDAGTILKEGEGSYAEASSNLEKLKYLAGEKYFVDIGLGFKENEDGQLIESSAFNASLTGLTFLGYGVDEDGDPKNIVSIVKRMSEITNSNEEFDYDEFYRLTGKLEDASSKLKVEYSNMDAESTKLKTNLELLEGNFDTLQEQYSGLEDVDMADSITSFVWAQYCYNAALKVGNSILSQSLIDYMN